MKEELRKKTKEIEEIIYPFFKVKGGHTSSLSDSMEYALTSGGKRLRPMIMREVSALFSEDMPKSLPTFMAAIEMIHNYSLVHDDLPAMDNDLLRHGKPSTFAKYGEANAILCGDGLLNLAYEIVFSYAKDNPNPDVIEAGAILSSCAGSEGMVGGQALDVMYDKSSDIPKREELLYIYENKTGKLFLASFLIGGILSGADTKEQKELKTIAENIGFAFQIVDDILDKIGDERELGKPIGSDSENMKHTYVDEFGIKESKAYVKELTDKAISLLMTLPGDKDFLVRLFMYLTERSA